jgi:hypothetical protein
MTNKNILIHDTSGVYMRFVSSKLRTNDSIFYTNDLENLYNVDFDKFTLLVLFINETEDLLDLAYLNSKNINMLVGANSSTFIFKKLLFFPNVVLFNLLIPKEDMFNLLKMHIEKLSPEMIQTLN